MSDSVPTQTATARAVADIEHLRCPKCDYDLSGTVEDRCSECGEPFDRETLIAWYAEGCDPLLRIGGDPTSTTALWSAALFCPEKLGRSFPPRPDGAWISRQALRGRLMASLALPFAATIPLAVTAGWPAAILLPIFFTPPVWLATYFCEVVLAAILSALVAPANVPPLRRFVFWKGLCQCFTGHLVVHSAGYSGLLAICFLVCRSAPPMLVLCAVPVLVLMWWWLGLTAAILARAEKSPGRIVAIGLIPLVGILAVFLAVAVMFVEASLCRL